MNKEIYRNIKKGTLYEVIGVTMNCTNAQDGQQMVMYRGLEAHSRIYVREYTEFYQKFEKVEFKE
jgi:hypothetical protein